ncbi:hypothetical protein GGD55_006320 [Rhizobium giardinii]|uniref:Uncharacterized protein n=1 Tax=Rhizobium giardinii TaxID=56731 RepID=A0A7W8XAN5_9HYPH|nr:hypothetical protein [Rhizobium giardinii]
MAGIRGNYAITPEIYLTGWGLIGAGQADLDWDVAAAIGYHFSDTISAVVGYRALGVDYSKDGFVFSLHSSRTSLSETSPFRPVRTFAFR